MLSSPLVVGLVILVGAGIFVALSHSSSSTHTEERVDWDNRRSVWAEVERLSRFRAACEYVRDEEEMQAFAERIDSGEIAEPLSMKGDSYWRNLTPYRLREAAHTHHHHCLERFYALGGQR